MKQIDVPLCVPDIGEEEFAAVKEVLSSGWLAHGPYNKKFEDAFCSHLSVPCAVTMNSCTSALEAALKVSNIKGEVIAPSFTWVATANCIVTAGATPVLCEVDPASRNVTAEHIAAHITPRTEAVIIVHYGGQMCQMDGIVELCERHNLLLIEDSAETLGATWKGRQAGSFGVGCFSFFPTKNVTTGEGGMLTCHDADFAARAKAMSGHGVFSTTLAREKEERPWLRAAEIPGHNWRMSNLLAAIGFHQMQRLDEMNAARQRLAARYDEFIGSELPMVKAPFVNEHATHVYQMYTIEVPEDRRNGIVMDLRAHGVGASVHFDPPVHLQPAYLDLGWKDGELPLTEKLSRELITLPIFPKMTQVEQDWVIERLKLACAGM